MLAASVLEASTPGLLGALPWGDVLRVTGCAVAVFGSNRLVPTYDPTFYKSLTKPSWNPPNYVFPLVWIPLKLLQTAAAFIVLKESSPKYLAVPATIFVGHLALGTWWNVVFFGKHKLKESLTWMGAFWGSVLATVASFYPVSRLAAALVAPTSIWVTIAAKLNYDIYSLNKDKDAGNGKEK